VTKVLAAHPSLIGGQSVNKVLAAKRSPIPRESVNKLLAAIRSPISRPRAPHGTHTFDDGATWVAGA
jgi:hypothetical protein